MQLSYCCLCTIIVFLLASGLQAQPSASLSKKLLARVSVEADNLPLSELLKELEETQKITITIDEAALLEEGVDPDDPVEMRLEKVKLAQALELAARSLDLTLIPTESNDELLLTTPVAMEKQFMRRQYLCPWISRSGVSMQKLADAVEKTTRGPWINIDGEGGEIVAVTGNGMQITQDWGSHQEIGRLLDQLQIRISGQKSAVDRFEAQVQTRLTRRVEIDGDELALTDFLNQTLAGNDINFWINRRALQDEGFTVNQKLKIVSGKQTIIEHLDATLAPVGLAAYLDREVVIVTTRIAAEDDMVIEVYDITRQARQAGTPDAVADIVMQTEGTGSWIDLDGGSGQCIALGNSLIVRQHRFGQQKIREMLK